jgi:hypothetical protein
MATITQQIPNYHGGISQQADEVKAPGQVNKLKNAIPDVVQGLVKRPGTQLLTAAGNITKIDNDKWFHYYRDETEQYIGRIDRSTGDIKMWDKTGTEKNVVYDPTDVTAIKNYLKTAATGESVPTEDELQTLTINDYTYLTNRNKTVAMDTDATASLNPVRPAEAYIELKKVAYARQYAVNLFDSNDTTDVTTATKVKVTSSALNNESSCPSVGTEIFKVGTANQDLTNEKQRIKFFDLTYGETDADHFFETDASKDYSLVYVPPAWTVDTYYQTGDLVQGKSDGSEIYKRTGAAGTGGSRPDHAVGGGDGSGDALNGWTIIASSAYDANDDVESRQLYHNQKCIEVSVNRQINNGSNQTVAWLADEFAAGNANFPFEIQSTTWDGGYASLTYIWKNDGDYSDHLSRVILRRTSGVNYTIGGNNVWSAFDGALITDDGKLEILSSGWGNHEILGAGRSDLYFRLTTTGQAVPNTGATSYTCRYTTIIDLLHGGSGWAVGDKIQVKMKDGVHVIQVEEISTSKEQANLALVRPSPTSFDTQTTVTAESIIGDIRAGLVATNNFTDSEVTQVGNGLYVTINKTVRTLASITDNEPGLQFNITNHGFGTGRKVKYNFTGTILDSSPSLVNDSYYWVIRNDANSFWLTTSFANAIAGTNKIDYSAAIAGGSAHTFTPEQTFGISSPDNDLLNVFTNEIQDIADLPSQCKHNYKLKVRNSEEEADDYYLKFIGQEKADGTFLDGKGVWEECAEPGRHVRLDYSTMPVGLVRTADGHFRVTQFDGTTSHIIYFPSDAFTSLGTSTIIFDGQTFTGDNSDTIDTYVTAMNAGSTVSGQLSGTSTSSSAVISGYHFAVSGDNVVVTEKPVSTYTFPTLTTSLFTGTSSKLPTKVDSITLPTWADCTVGSWNSTDKTGTAPEPSFVGYTINQVISFRNRLGILSDENVNLSRPGLFFNFWPKSAIAYSAADNIDVSCSSIHPAILYDAIEINTGLLLFSKNEQFMLTTDSDVLSPLTAKINSFCTYNFNQKTKPISLGTTVGFLDNASRYSRFFEATNLVREGTPNVFEQSKIVSKLLPKDLTLITNSRENSTIFFAERGSHTIYGLKYLTGGDRRLQQAWFTWEMSSPVQHMALMDDALYIVLRDQVAAEHGDAASYKDTIQKITLRLASDSLSIEDDNDTVITNDGIVYPIHLDSYIKIAAGDLSESIGNDTIFTNTLNLRDLGVTTFRASNIITVTRNNHGFKVGQRVYLKSNSFAGEFTIQTVATNSFTGTVTGDNFGSEGSQQAGHINLVMGAVAVPSGTTITTNQGLYGKPLYITASPNDDLINGTDWDATNNTLDVYVGYLFDMEVELPTIYPVKTANNNIIADYTGGLVVHRAELNLGQNAIYEVELERGMKKADGTRDKTTYSESIGPLTAATPPVVATDYYNAAYVMPLEEDGQQVIPIYEKNKNLTLTFKSTSPSPATLYSMTWEGDFTNNHYERVT